MKIRNISIGSFGKLSDRSFEFSDGVNVIYGENEAGKSTLSAFIKYILYGFSSRSKDVSANDKLKYAPWSSDILQGSVSLYSGGRALRIERTSGTKNSLSVFDTESGEKLNFGKTPGEELLGVDESAFSKMAFIRQADISADGMDGLSENIQNIVYSADETVNIEKARKKLSECRNVYYNKSRSTGRCFELSEKISSLKNALDNSSETHAQLLSAESKLSATRAKIAENKGKIEILEEELRNIEAYEAKLLLETIHNAENEFLFAKEQYLEAEKKLTLGGKFRDESDISEIVLLRENLVSKKEAAGRKMNEITAENKNISDGVRNSGIPVGFRSENFDHAYLSKRFSSLTMRKNALTVFGIVLALAAAGLFAFAFAAAKDSLFVPLAISASAGIALSVILFIISASASSKMNALCREYVAKDPKSMRYALEIYPEVKNSVINHEMRKKLLEDELLSLNSEKESLEERLYDTLSQYLDDVGDKSFLPDKAELAVSALRRYHEQYVTCKARFEASRSAYETLLSAHDPEKLAELAVYFREVPQREKKIVLRDRQFFEIANETLAEKEKDYIKQSSLHTSLLRKPAEILSELKSNEALLSQATLKAEALELAMSALDEACDEVRKGISPQISERSGELFRKFTDGKYEGLELSPAFDPGIMSGGIRREGGFLSTGTKDAAYLALRIALCEALFTEKPILVLDEAFAYIDDERLKSILSVLHELASEYQIFIFTCHKREKEFFSSCGDVNVIGL